MKDIPAGGAYNEHLSGFDLQEIYGDKPKEENMKLKYEQMLNGKFAVCPDCGKLMAKGVCGDWWCVTGCGLKVKPKSKESKC